MDANVDGAVKPTCWIISGPNGAGKTKFALRYLKTLGCCKRFINADLIAAGLLIVFKANRPSARLRLAR